MTDAAPGLRARLLEEFIKERTLLEQSVAERLGRPPDDVFCVVTARLATVLLELAADLVRATAGDDPAIATRRILELVHGVMAKLHEEPPVVPRFTDRVSSLSP